MPPSEVLTRPDIDTEVDAAALGQELAEVRSLLAEALEALEAIRNGDVDALVVGGPHNRQIYTLETADRSYRLLIERMTDGAIMLSPEDAVLYSNQALADMLGTTTGRLVGGCFAAFVDPGSEHEFRSLLANGGKAELVLVRADSGEPFIAQLSLTQMNSPDGMLLCGVLTDLTSTYEQAREVAETKSVLAVQAARREIDERYRLILEGVTDYAIVATDLDQKVTIWNSGAQDILGWQASELIGGPLPMIWTADAAAAGSADEERARCLASGRVEEERWHCRKDGAPFWAHSLMMPLREDQGRHIGFLRILRDRTEQRASDERQTLLINELNHRVKNTLATVQSIATQTLRAAPTTRDGLAALEERLVALSRAHDVLTRESWDGAELGEIVALAVAPYLGETSERINTVGPAVRLKPRIALALAMALQELATNAVKYGALSLASGVLNIAWTMHGRRLVLRWEESHGPVVAAPLRRGFGSRLIERSLAAELGGDVLIDFAPTGVVCEIAVELAE
jgi:PAS domain S-box-containing protein